MSAHWRIVCGFALSVAIFGQTYYPPAGIRPARRGLETSILPGGRILAPAGEQFFTDQAPAALALSATGKVLVTANRGPALSLTVIERGEKWELHQFPLTRAAVEPVAEKPGRRAPAGVAVARERAVFVSEGNSGRIALIDVVTGDRRSAFDLNRSGYQNSVTGALAMDAARNILYVADEANSRVVVIDARLGPIDARPRGILASVTLHAPPGLLALSPDRKELYVTGADALSAIDVSEPAAAKVAAEVRMTSPAGMAVTASHVYVTNAEDDSISVIDRATNRVESEIPIRIPGLDQLRGVAPAGLAYDDKTEWLLAAEAGINAVAVIDSRSSKVLGHIPAGWSPTLVLADRGTVYVANWRGMGVGPSVVPGSGYVRIVGEEGTEGSISIFPLPALAELAGDTAVVLRAAGLDARAAQQPDLPPQIRHVILIVSPSRAFDELLGDVRRAANGPVAGAPALAHYGKEGYADGKRALLSLHDVDVAPNHHAIAQRWAFSDNFYAVSGGAAESWSKVWDHLKSHGVSFFHFDAAEPAIRSSDTTRASRVISEIKDRFAAPGTDLPQFVRIDLPNGRIASPRAADGYPYEESFVADNDNAVGSLLQFLSGTRWWENMAVFITEESAQGGADHIDAYRTVLLCAGPWVRRNYVSHRNTSFSGLLKTVFEILHVPPLSLFDASAADLSDCFRPAPDANPYRLAPIDRRLYEPGSR